MQLARSLPATRRHQWVPRARYGGIFALGGLVGIGVWVFHLPSIALVPVASGCEQPTTLIEVDGELLVAERTGRVIVLGREEPLLNLTDVIEADYYERGLLGLAADDDELFVHYTDHAGDSVVAAYSRASQERREILTVEQPAMEHNGGQLAFGPDGYLYVGIGDGVRRMPPNRALIFVVALNP